MENRPKMSRADRAKQFMPFDALKGFREALQEKERIVVPKAEIPDDAAEAVDHMFHSISQGDMAAVTYYHNGEYVRVTGIISKLDMQKKKLSIVNTEILFSDIYEIQKE